MKKLFKFLLNLYYRRRLWKIFKMYMKHPSENPRNALEDTVEAFNSLYDFDNKAFYSKGN